MKRTRILLTFLAVAWIALGAAFAQPRTELPDDARFDVHVAFSTGHSGESLKAMVDALARSVGLTPVVDAIDDVTIVYDIGDPKPFRQVWALVLMLNDLDFVLQPNDVVVVGTPERLRRLSGVETREPSVQRFYRVTNDPAQVAAILERIAPDATIDTLPGNNALVVVGTEAEHEAVTAALEEFDQPRDAIALEQRTFFLSYAPAATLAATIERTLIVVDASGSRVTDYTIVPDERTNSLVVTGTTNVLDRIGQLVSELDTPEHPEAREPEPEPTVRRLYRDVGVAERAAAIVERVLPEAVVTMLPGTNAFYVTATEAEHEAAMAALEEFAEQLQPPEPTVQRFYRVNNDPADVAAMLNRVVPDARVDTLPGNNAVVVVATEAQHEAVEQALEEFDQPPPVVEIPEPEPEPEPIAEEPDPTVRRMYRAVGEVSRVAAIVERVVPDATVTILPGTDAFYVTGSETEHEAVEAALEEFDARPDETEGPSVERIYRVNNEPSQVAAVLQRVVPSARVDVLPGTNALLVVATEERHEAVATALLEFDAPADVVPLVQRTYFLSNARASELASTLQDTVLISDSENGTQRLDDFTVIAEPRTNALIVTGTAAVQARMAELIRELDDPQRQVNIQVRIQEITRSAAFTLGIDWGAGFGNLTTQVLSGGLGFIFDTTQVISSLNVLAVLDALETQGLSRRVDDSNITVVDNGTGSIQSGGTIFITLPGANQNIERTIPYGVQIEVTPRIAADGRITLEVDASVEDVLSTTADPTFLELSTRAVNTVVSVDPGQTVLLGGLLQNSLSLSRNQIPVLGSLPLIGDLFSRNITEEDSVDLLIIVTAQVLD